jgi:stage IV sporulation protein A
MAERSIYEQIAQRTDGNIYLSVVGPVRTGKSTFIKRFMETLVIPNIDNVYRRERAKDELPQSGAGKTIMTAEPKFIPEEAVEICPDGVTRLSVRLVDTVGYMVSGAIGATEDGVPRMVTTPWFDHELPMTEAAELGTKKVMEDHATLGLVITTDGTITDIPREDYAEAEARSIQDMQQTGKPFAVLINSAQPEGEAARSLQASLAENFGVHAGIVNCLTLDEADICAILRGMLAEFPMQELRFYLPSWFDTLPQEHSVKTELYAAILEQTRRISRISDAKQAVQALTELDTVERCTAFDVDLGTGTVTATLAFPETLFYSVLGELSGFTITGDRDLLDLLTNLSAVKRDYDTISSALDEVRATGYGIVMPRQEQMHLETPEVVRRGSTYGIKLRASAPSIHMMRADIQTEISPMVGDEKQSQELVDHLLGDYQENAERLWQSNIFGKSVYDLINDGLTTKLTRMPMESRCKFKDALARIINEGAGGLICIIL